METCNIIGGKMSHPVLLSVVVPVYNVEKYLKICVESILVQNVASMEILLIDDGSTDGSGDICDILAQSDARIKVVHQQNMGVSAARNCGVKMAKGKYLSFVDSDDFLNANMYTTMISIAEANHTDIVICGVEYKTHEKTNFSAYSSSGRLPEPAGVLYDVYSCKSLLQNLMFCTPCNKLFSADFIKSNNFAYKTDVRYEDFRIWPEQLFQAERLMYIDKLFYCYRVEREDSFSNSNYISYEGFPEALCAVLESMKHKGFFEKFYSIFFSFSLLQMVLALNLASLKNRKVLFCKLLSVLNGFFTKFKWNGKLSFPMNTAAFFGFCIIHYLPFFHLFFLYCLCFRAAKIPFVQKLIRRIL